MIRKFTCMMGRPRHEQKETGNIFYNVKIKSNCLPKKFKHVFTMRSTSIIYYTILDIIHDSLITHSD
jgi:hypothetical protein